MTRACSSPTAARSARAHASRRPANGARTPRWAAASSRSTRPTRRSGSPSPRPARSKSISPASTCCPLRDGGLIVLEVNGAADFDERYALPGHDVYEDVAFALELDGVTVGT